MSGPVAILCSGQGGQHRDMFRLVGAVEAAAPVFAAAAAVLGSDPRDFVRNEAEAALFANRAGQILCCTQALAAWAMLAPLRPFRAVLAGYSVGELSAWGCAGYFEAGQLLRLAAQRADAMDRAAPVKAGLAGIVGLRRDRLDPLLQRHLLHLAIINGEDSFVIGGDSKALDACLPEALHQGALRAARLRVAVPSHTSLLQEAGTGFAAILAREPIGRGNRDLRLLSGIDAETVRDPRRGLAGLAAQMTQTIDWEGNLRACVEAGATVFLELGPGTALAGMASHLPDHMTARSLEQFRTVNGVLSWLAGAATGSRQ